MSAGVREHALLNPECEQEENNPRNHSDNKPDRPRGRVSDQRKTTELDRCRSSEDLTIDSHG
jgi:hypothetical protein